MTCCDAWYSLGAALDGMGMPSPPILAGKANRVRSRSPGPAEDFLSKQE